MMEFKKGVLANDLVATDGTYSWIVFKTGDVYQASYRKLDGTGLSQIFCTPTETYTGADMIKAVADGKFLLPYPFKTVEEAIAACRQKQKEIKQAVH